MSDTTDQNPSLSPPSLTKLAWRFLKLGATAYGGPAIVLQVKKLAVDQTGWLTEPEFLQGIALCQFVPGATNVQVSTYVGQRLRGAKGAVVCAVSFVLPAFVLLLGLSALYFRFGRDWLTRSLFKGLGAIVVAIVLDALVSFGKPVLKDWRAALIAVLSFAGYLERVSILVVFLLAGLLALFLHPVMTAYPANGRVPDDRRRPMRRRGDWRILAALGLFVAGTFAACHRWNPTLFRLAAVLAKIGALAFGGGFTVIPLIQYEVVHRAHWVSTREFVDAIAMGQVTPGPIMISATLLGYKLAGIVGGAMATLAIFAPAFFIVTILAPYYERLRTIAPVRTIEQGILASFVGLLGLVLFHFGQAALTDLRAVIFSGAAFIALQKKVRLVYVLLVGAALAALVFGIWR